MKNNLNSEGIGNTVSFTPVVCADGICCFMSIPRKQSHLGIWKTFLKRRNASYGIKLLYTTLHAKDAVFNPCKCLEFHLKEVNTMNRSAFQVLLRCGIFGKRCRPYTCNEFPDKADSFMYDILAPCIYNEYRASENYVMLKYKHNFHLYYAIKDERKLLEKISPGQTAEETRKKLSQCEDVVKISAIWNEKPSEYFLLKVPKVDSVVYSSDVHPKIECVKQAYERWQGHIESWLEKHYGTKWQEYLNRALEQENKQLKTKKNGK